MQKWNVEDNFNFQKETIDGATYVVKIVCKLCTKHVLAIERSDQMKGVARTQIRTYVDGSTYVTKHNVDRHISGKVSLLSIINDSNMTYSVVVFGSRFCDIVSDTA